PRQLHRGRAALAAHNQSMQVLRPQVRRQSEQLAVGEAAAAAVVDARPAEEVLDLGKPLLVELRFIAGDRGQLLLERVADVHDDRAMPVTLLGIEGKRTIDEMWDPKRGRTGEPVMPLG